MAAATTEYIAVLPEGIKGEGQYLRLLHPRTGAPQLYLPYEGGICEVVKVSGTHGRTWFIGDDKVAEGSMLVHLPVDPLFFAIPIALLLIPTDARPAQFQLLSDLFATAASSAALGLKPAFSPTADAESYNADVSRLLEDKRFRAAFRACCEKKLVGAAPPSPPADGEETAPEQSAYFRPSRDVILAVLKLKVENLAKAETFAKFDHLVRSLGRDGLLESGVDEKLVQVARTSAAIDQIAHFLPPAITSALSKCYDTAALDTYLADRAAAARAAAAPVVQSNGKAKGAAAAKRKAQPASRGVEQLKKVKTEGMSKLTSFFKPKEKEKQ